MHVVPSSSLSRPARGFGVSWRQALHRIARTFGAGRPRSAARQDASTEWFRAALAAVLAEAAAGAAAREISLETSIAVTGEPFGSDQPLVLNAAALLVRDAVERSLQPRLPGTLHLAFEAPTRLVVEDNGWANRSHRQWARDNAALVALIEHAGGDVRREFDWVVTRTIVRLPPRGRL